MYERSREIQNTRVFVFSILGNAENLSILLDTDKNPRLLENVRTKFNRYSKEKTTQLVGGILTIAGNDSRSVDQRDGALRLLKEVPFTTKEVSPSVLAGMYLRQLNNLGDSLDPLGAIDSMLDAGIILIPYLPTKRTAINAIAMGIEATRNKLQSIPGIHETESKINALKYSLFSREDEEAEDHWNPDIPTELVETARDGNSEALTELFRTMYEDVYNLAFQLVKNEHDAEDVVQNVNLRVLTGIGNLKRDSAFQSWLYKIIKNCSKNMLLEQTRKAIEPLYEIRDESSGNIDYIEIADPHPDSNIEKVFADRDQLRSALMNLNPMARKVIVLRDICDLPFKEVSQLADIKLVAAKVSHHRSLAKLRRIFPAE